MPPDSFKSDGFTYADATAASAHDSRGQELNSCFPNQVDNSSGGNPKTNGEHIYFAEEGATVPISILKKGNREEVSPRFSYTLCLSATSRSSHRIFDLN